MHLIAWSETQAAATFTAVAAVPDTSMNLEAGDGFVVPSEFPELFAGAAIGSTLLRARYTAPSIERRRATVDIWPLADSADAFALTHPQIWMPLRGIPLDPGEVLGAKISQDSGTTDLEVVLAFLKAPGALPAMPTGEIIQIRATGTTTLTAGAWTLAAMTLDQELPSGRYALVGFVPMGVSPVAARVVIPGQGYRPGMPALIGTLENDSLNADFSTMKKLMYYNMGEFANTNVPSFEFLASAGDTAQTVYLFVVKVA